jgi:hypothetical protein
VKIKILDYKAILEELSISLVALKEYLDGGRKDVLHNTDIFCENVRTINLVEKDFSLFSRVDSIDSDTVVVFPIYLELFEFLGLHENVKRSIEIYSSRYPDNKVVFFWNHDRDFKDYNETTLKNKNCRVINYNTSEKTGNDIVVPFWTMEDIAPIKEEKQIYCSFIGRMTHETRRLIARKIIEYDSPKFQYFNSLAYNEYRKKLSQTKFSLCPRGAGLSSYRFFECIHANTIPVLIADSVVLPYQDELDYSKFSVRVLEKDAGNLELMYSSFKSLDYDSLMMNLNQVRNNFSLPFIQKYIHDELRKSK